MAEAAKIVMAEGTVPTTPTTNHWAIYPKTDGLYQVDDAGTETSLTAVAAHAASHTDGTDDIQDATAAQKGLMTLAYAGKLDGVEALADVTDAANVGAVLNTLLTPEDVTADNTITAGELNAGGKIFTNLGDAGLQTQTLPAGAAGLKATFCVVAAFEMRIDPQAGDAIIYSGGLMSDGEYLSSSDVGSCITLIGLSDGNWFAIHESGTWTEETP